MEEQQSRISVESLAYDDEKMEACLAEVGSRIREERIKQELSISKLAELSNLSVSCISKAETEKCRISLKALIKIATALKVPVRQFLDIDGIDLAVRIGNMRTEKVQVLQMVSGLSRSWR